MDGLLDGPRGRMLCLELAKIADPGVGEALGDLAFNADVAAGNAVVRFGVDERGKSWSSKRAIRRPRFTLDELAARVSSEYLES